ncbi:MAG: cation:proton antiporter [Burkholderiaceae bacterium]
MPVVTQEIAFLLLIFALMVVPRLVQRLRIPSPLTSFALGLAATLMLGSYAAEPTLSLLATLGISSLFLFAGLEIELDDFRRGRWPLIHHLAMRAVALAALTWLSMQWLDPRWQVGVLLALAVLTPSAGFILDTLPMLDISESERYWVRMKAVTGELFALGLLFVVLQSGSIANLAWSTAALAAMIVALPLIYIGLGRAVIPHARGSEFSLLVMVGVIAAFLTYKLGVYYLVGAFLAGFIAKLLHRRVPTFASPQNLHAIRMFASFFVPFYFFHRGMGVPSGALTLQALGVGLTLTTVALPLRIGLVWAQRRFIKGESSGESLRVAAALTPTLIFTLVLASILRERFQLGDALYGGLLIYAGMSTLLPSMMMARPVDFDLLPDTLPMPADPASGADRPDTALR